MNPLRFLALILGLIPTVALAISLPQGIPSQSDWLHAMRAGQRLDLPGKVMRARVLFTNVAWSPESDPDGHWATPAELLRRGSGDLLDIVTAYYFTLRGMGVAAADIRMFFGKRRTLDEPVPHILMAVRHGHETYFVDPLRDVAMTDETPTEFRPTLAFNETGAWRTGALTDLSIWTTLGSDPENIPRWLGVCYSALGMMGMLQPMQAVALLENNPPASGHAAKPSSKFKTTKVKVGAKPAPKPLKATATPALTGKLK
jgi:hypothetical protein